MASRAHSTGPRPQAPIAVSSRFDWLEGATGVRLAIGARDHTRFVCVTGDVDRASIDVIQTALRDAFDDSARVELDLCGVDAGRGALIPWAQACCAERDAELVIRSAGHAAPPRPPASERARAGWRDAPTCCDPRAPAR